MKTKIIAVIFFLSLGIITRAQNLVYNGYFEINDTCPHSASLYPNNMEITYALGWHASSLTPDYFNACTSTNVNVPHNLFGYQKDCCGGGYAGISPFYMNTTNNDGREYIYTKLVDTLKVGHKYLASMYVNKADGWNYAVATMGMLFTDTAIVLPYPQSSILTMPQVKNTTLIADTSHWTLIQDTITATGNEVYLTIGNFNTSATCDSVNVGGNGMYFGEAYYYIDGVSVYDLATMGIEQIAVSNEQLNIYPNPSDGNMAVEYKITNDAELQIIDLNGNLVEAYNLPTTGNRIEVKNQNLQNGVYLYRISSNNAVIKFGKVVIMK